MNLRAFLEELTKIADGAPPSPSKPTPINAVPPGGPRVPNPGGLPKKPPVPNAMFSAFMGGANKAKTNPFATMLAKKLAAIGARTMLPSSSPLALAGGRQRLPAAARSVTPITEAGASAVRARHAQRGFMAPGSVPSHPPPSASGTYSVAPPSHRVTPPTSAVSPTIPAPNATHTPTTPAPASNRASTQVTVAPPARLPKFAEVANPPHGHPKHIHAKSVERLRAAMALKHPHLLAGPEKKASVGDMLRSAGKNLVKHEDTHEIAGLGMLALPSLDNVQARFRGGDENNDKHLLPGVAHDAMEIGGLTYLAAPMIAKKGLGPKAVRALGAH